MASTMWDDPYHTPKFNHSFIVPTAKSVKSYLNIHTHFHTTSCFHTDLKKICIFSVIATSIDQFYLLKLEKITLAMEQNEQDSKDNDITDKIYIQRSISIQCPDNDTLSFRTLYSHSLLTYTQAYTLSFNGHFSI